MAVSERRSRSISAMELLGIAGFAFLFGWVFVACFWIFCEYPPGVPVPVRDLSQLAVFVGIPVSYGVLYLLGRDGRFNLFSLGSLACGTTCFVLLPFVALLMFNGVFVPLWAVCVVNLFTGFAAAFFILCWLDILSRLRCASYSRFTGLALASGVILFAVSALAPEHYEPVFILVYGLCSLSLLVYLTQNADANDECADLEAVAEPWRFTKEIEPSFFVFGIVFALTFVFLFNEGKEYVLWGIIAVGVGAVAIIIPTLVAVRINITVVQRVLLVITVISCIALPFAPPPMQLLCACLTTAAWGAFKAMNYSFVVKKSIAKRDAPFFRQAPLRLSISSWGFAVGWAIAALTSFWFDAHSDPFTTVRLVMVVVLVIVVMAFFPKGEHHPSDGTEFQEGVAAKVVSVEMSESKLLDARCTAVAKLYQLSPREEEILGFLVRGRNATWIQGVLTISPHTVKSHIYNIYRKLDIHSQQKLMSFVEEFPIDL